MIRVLVIDDSDTHRLITRRWLESLCPNVFEVTEATNAEDGFNLAVSINPHCILLDYIMVGADGFQTIHKMEKEILNCPPIIFMTCALTEDLKRNAMALGAYACFDKGTVAGTDLVHAVMAATIANPH